MEMEFERDIFEINLKINIDIFIIIFYRSDQ